MKMLKVLARIELHTGVSNHQTILQIHYQEERREQIPEMILKAKLISRLNVTKMRSSQSLEEEKHYRRLQSYSEGSSELANIINKERHHAERRNHQQIRN